MFCKKCVLRNFAKFTGKHLSQSLFFNKVADQIFLIENECKTPYWTGTLAQVFSCEFCKISKNTFSTEHLRTTASSFLWRIIHIVISFDDWSLLTAWLLLWDGGLLRSLFSLRITFNCSPDVISPSFVLNDFVVFIFLQVECFRPHDLNKYSFFHLFI